MSILQFIDILIITFCVGMICGILYSNYHRRKEEKKKDNMSNQ